MKILVTGGSGLTGRYLKKILPEAIYVNSKDFDLTRQRDCRLLIAQERPDRVIHLAAKVGGILDNQRYPCDYFEQNISMNTNIIEACRVYGVKRFTGVLSTCAYPDHVMGPSGHPGDWTMYPLEEESLHAGPPSKSNFGYGIAKRAMAAHIETCNEQHGTEYNYVIPCNMYGFYDDFHPERSHYVAALIRKIHLAVKDDSHLIELFGTGRPLRQFMYAEDFARILFMIADKDITESFNVATPEVKTIREIAEVAIDAIDVDIALKFNPSYPDGQYRKDVSIEKFQKIFPDFKFTPLAEGIKKTYDYYSKS